MTELSVLVVVPVLDRPERVRPLAVSLAESVRDVPLGLLFVTSPGDDLEIAQVHRLMDDVHYEGATPFDRLRSVGQAMVDWPPGRGDWARKINFAYGLLASFEPWIFTGADDLHFHPGWADEAIRVAGEAGAGVVGTNDLGNPRVTSGKHATHSLVSRAYANEHGTIDGPGAVVCEAYSHNYVDDELVSTARARGAYVFAESSRVEHLHPNWGKGKRDAIYDKGEAEFAADRILFTRRRRLWSGNRGRRR